MVLGGPGAGKSTFLRKVGLEALKGNKGEYTHHCLPVLLELKHFRDAAVDLETLLLKEFSTCGFQDPEQVKTKLLEQGKLLILLDGLDEVPTQYVDQAIDPDWIALTDAEALTPLFTRSHVNCGLAHKTH